MSLLDVKLKPIMNRITTLAVATLALSTGCDAFFRNLMIGDTAMARIDPIVNRGEPAAHVHHLTGGGSKFMDCEVPQLLNDYRSKLRFYRQNSVQLSVYQFSSHTG